MLVRHDSPTNTRDIRRLTTLYCKICIALDPAMDATQSIPVVGRDLRDAT